MLDNFTDEIEGIIKTFVPIKIKGNDLGRNTCQRKRYKDCLQTNNVENIQKHWKIEDYNNYKKAPNLATAEMRKSKRSFGQTFANDIKSDSKSFYAYVKNKQKVRDKVGSE